MSKKKTPSLKKEIELFLGHLAFAKDTCRHCLCDGTFTIYIDFGDDKASSFWADYYLHQLWMDAKKKREAKHERRG